MTAKQASPFHHVGTLRYTWVPTTISTEDQQWLTRVAEGSIEPLHMQTRPGLFHEGLLPLLFVFLPTVVDYASCFGEIS